MRVKTTVLPLTAALLGCGVAGSSLASAGQPPPKPPKSGAVSLAAKPAIVVYGSATTLSGRVEGAKGGVAVSLQRDPFPLGDGLLPFRATTTAANGSFSFALTPVLHTSYRAVAATAPSKASPTVLVRVRMRVGLRLSTSTPTAGRTVRFSGSVHPAHDGRTASIQKRSSTGSWTTVARTTLQDAGTTRSSYSRRVRINRDGVYRVKVAGDADHLSGFSRSRSIDAR
jgi:hypothetical protein